MMRAPGWYAVQLHAKGALRYRNRQIDWIVVTLHWDGEQWTDSSGPVPLFAGDVVLCRKERQ
jgi:hypothetical protein